MKPFWIGFTLPCAINLLASKHDLCCLVPPRTLRLQMLLRLFIFCSTQKRATRVANDKTGDTIQHSKNYIPTTPLHSASIHLGHCHYCYCCCATSPGVGDVGYDGRYLAERGVLWVEKGEVVKWQWLASGDAGGVWVHIQYFLGVGLHKSLVVYLDIASRSNGTNMARSSSMGVGKVLNRSSLLSCLRSI